MKKISLFIITVLFCFLNISAQEKIKLKFKKDGKFRIAQFTDIHWIDGSPNCAKTIATIKYVLETEKPDLAVLTGDVAWKLPSRQPWRDISGIFEEAKIPFAVALGNHDGEGSTQITRAEIFDLLSQSPYFVGEKGPDNIYGCGNYVIPVWGKKSKASALLYCFDSNRDSKNPKFGGYDHIRFDQIEWYRKQSESHARANGNSPLPALAFFHIPLPEISDVVAQQSTIGTFGESFGSPRFNSGLFGSFMEMGDVMGVFTGHDHANDFIGMDYNIALAYGRVTGTDAYGKLVRGGRLIELFEDEFRFDSWISTPEGKELYFHYPSGISSVDEDKMTYLPAIKVNPRKQGVSYTYYEGKFKSLKDTASAVKAGKGNMKEISIQGALSEDGFAYDFRTYLKIPDKGVYLFQTRSDDGSKLYVDGQLIVDNDHDMVYKSGKTALEAGFHELRVLYYEDDRRQHLEVGFSDKHKDYESIPGQMLYVTE